MILPPCLSAVTYHMWVSAGCQIHSSLERIIREPETNHGHVQHSTALIQYDPRPEGQKITQQTQTPESTNVKIRSCSSAGSFPRLKKEPENRGSKKRVIKVSLSEKQYKIHPPPCFGAPRPWDGYCPVRPVPKTPNKLRLPLQTSKL